MSVASRRRGEEGIAYMVVKVGVGDSNPLAGMCHIAEAVVVVFVVA